MKNPVTTILGILAAVGVLARAVTLIINGQVPDYTEITLAIGTVLAAIGLYKAQDPGK